MCRGRGLHNYLPCLPFEVFLREEKLALTPFHLEGSEGGRATPLQIGEFNTQLQIHNFKQNSLHGYVSLGKNCNEVDSLKKKKNARKPLMVFGSTIPIIQARAREQTSLRRNVLLQLLILRMRFQIP